MRRARFISIVVAAGFLGAVACSGNSDGGSQLGRAQSAVLSLPSQVLGLAVKAEDVTKQTKGIKRSYTDSVGLFSMRENDLLRATLQVSRLNNLARPQSESFQRSIIELVGGSTPLKMRAGEVTVYTTSGNKQNIFIWFRGKGMFILSVHQDYEFPRTLLRKIVPLEIR